MFNRFTCVAWFFGFALALATSLVLCNPASAVIIVPNNSFETHGTGQGFTPSSGIMTVGSWTFGVSSGVTMAYDGISMNLAGMTAAPDGSVAAFIEGPGTFSQPLSGFLSGVRYSVSFYAEKYSGNGEPLQLLIDATALTFNAGAASTQLPGSYSAFTQYTTDPFTVATGSHTLTFNGTVADGTGHISFIDLVTVNELPEPASLGLMAVGGLMLLRRRAHR